MVLTVMNNIRYCLRMCRGREVVQELETSLYTLTSDHPRPFSVDDASALLRRLQHCRTPFTTASTLVPPSHRRHQHIVAASTSSLPRRLVPGRSNGGVDNYTVSMYILVSVWDMRRTLTLSNPGRALPMPTALAARALARRSPRSSPARR